jgi:predicted small lipoprotein YifL
MRAIFISILFCFALSACGSKGDLYIPEQTYPQGNP